MNYSADKFLKAHGVYTGMGLYEISVKNLEDFAKLVEQATLERAAVECNELSKYMQQDDHMQGCIDSAHAIRTLKTKGE